MTLSAWGNPSSTGATQSSSKISILACGRNLFSAKRDGVVSTVSPMERNRTSRTRLTSFQFQIAAASGCGSWSSPRQPCCCNPRSCGDDSTMFFKLCKACSGSFWCFVCWIVLDRCFVNQHDRNVVADGINAEALHAFQATAVGLQFNFRLTGRAGEYFQSIITNRNSAWTSHCGYL